MKRERKKKRTAKDTGFAWRFMRKTKPQRRWKPDGTKIAKAYETSYEAVLSLKESESADAPEVKITTPLANTEVAEGGGLKLKIGINEKKDTEEKPDEKADDKTDDRTESPWTM